MRRIPLAGSSDLLRRARRTIVIRATLGCAIVGVLVASTWLAAGRGPDPGPIVQPGVKTMLVLDVSTSIRPRLNRQIEATLTRAISAGGRLGLIVFSDTAYELLAPDTAAAELEGIARFFRPLRSNPSHAPTTALGKDQYLQAPWAQTLSGGTRISSGLELARLTLGRDGGGRGAVVLLSDLGDEVGDLAEFAAEAKLIAEQGMQLRIVALSPKPSDLTLARELLAGGRGTIVEAADPEAARTQLHEGGGALSVGILVLGGVLLLLLALNEMLCARLVLRPGEGMS
jgi:Mg-chelatase subunit ChlD